MDQPGGVATRDLHRRVHRPRNRCGRPDTHCALDDWSDGDADRAALVRNALSQSRAVMWRASPVAAICSLPDCGACLDHRPRWGTGSQAASSSSSSRAPPTRTRGDDAALQAAWIAIGRGEDYVGPEQTEVDYLTDPRRRDLAASPPPPLPPPHRLLRLAASSASATPPALQRGRIALSARWFAQVPRRDEIYGAR